MLLELLDGVVIDKTASVLEVVLGAAAAEVEAVKDPEEGMTVKTVIVDAAADKVTVVMVADEAAPKEVEVEMAPLGMVKPCWLAHVLGSSPCRMDDELGREI